jgi:hypothetical protein
MYYGHGHLAKEVGALFVNVAQAFVNLVAVLIDRECGSKSSLVW